MTHETEDGDVSFAGRSRDEGEARQGPGGTGSFTGRAGGRAWKHGQCLQGVHQLFGYGLQGSQHLSGAPRCHVYRSEEGVPKDRRLQTQSRRCPRKDPVPQGAMSTSYEGAYESVVLRIACQRDSQRHSRAYVWRPRPRNNVPA